jgi:site-specific DNA-methyltransferase (adenine-specific)
MLELNKIYFHDCLEGMKLIDDKSIDMILCDLPYNKTQHSWDNKIDLNLLWPLYLRVTKENSPIVFTASLDLIFELIQSNKKMFKYEWVWAKSKSSTPLCAKIMPMRKHEYIVVFGKGKITYNPQMEVGIPYKRINKDIHTNHMGYGINKINIDNKGERFPSSVIYFQQKWRRQDQLHTSQKPIELFEYLIKTYTNEGDLVLDNCIGSGTTAVAAKNLKRNFIGFENNEQYYKIARNRIGQKI